MSRESHWFPNLATLPRRLAGWLHLALDPRFWAWAAIGLGIVFRLAEYANARNWWIDEDCLRDNVVGRPIFDFLTPMVRDQLAPPGFLAVSRTWARIAGKSAWSLRIPPLIFGIAALFAIRSAALRYVDRRAVPVVLWVCASSWELVYFATEFKQYSSDLLVTLLLLILADDLARHELTKRRFAVALAGGMLASWCSIPSIFVLGGVGLSLAVGALSERRWQRLGWLSLLGVLWAANFGICFAICRKLLGRSDFMWTWWDFAFLPIPPRSWGDLSRVFWTFANVFIAPCGLECKRFPVGTALLAVTLFVIGAVGLAGRRKAVALMALLLPILLAMIASAMRRYPFHGRLLVYLVPPFVLLMAQGIAELSNVASAMCGRFRRVGTVLGRGVLVVVSLVLILPPTIEAVNLLDQPRPRGFDSHGDPRNDLLDYFEERARAARLVHPIRRD